jgi:hypothetical protein
MLDDDDSVALRILKIKIIFETNYTFIENTPSPLQCLLLEF